ncbi:MAG: DUF2490 domain-containing protein [Opitutales bacterium]
MKRCVVWFLLFFTCLGLRAENELWMSFDFPTISKGAFSTRTHTHWRFAEDAYVRYYRLSQKFFYKVDDTWTLGLHPVHNESRRSENGEWSHRRRLDFEANPKFKVGNMTVSMRNRFELRWFEGQGSELFNRARHRTALSWKGDWLPGLKSFGVSNEVFYDLDASRISGNWLMPVKLNFEPADFFKGSLGYQIASSKRGNGDWSHKHVLALSGSLVF